VGQPFRLPPPFEAACFWSLISTIDAGPKPGGSPEGLAPLLLEKSRISVEIEEIRVWRESKPVLTPAEIALVDQVAELTRSKRTDVIKSALAVYHWFVRQALTGNRVVARKPTGEEVILETPELAVLEGKGNRLGPRELGAARKASRRFVE